MPVVTDHIRGPWRAEGWENLVVNDADGNTVVCCPGGSRGATLDQLQARAALIAAAPETARHRDTLIDALHDLLTRPTDAAARLRARAAIEAASVPADPAAEALRRAESFIAGFEDDETQEGIADLLAAIRAAIAGAPADPVRDAAPDLLHWLKGITGRLMDLREYLSETEETEIGLALFTIAKAEGRKTAPANAAPSEADFERAARAMGWMVQNDRFVATLGTDVPDTIDNILPTDPGAWGLLCDAEGIDVKAEGRADG